MAAVRSSSRTIPSSASIRAASATATPTIGSRTAPTRCVNRAYCIANPKGFAGYGADCWGLTASDSIDGYAGHSPTDDRGVISPTAALSSYPYAPSESLAALRHFASLGDRLWGEYGFRDAFSHSADWYCRRHTSPSIRGRSSA